MTDTTKKAHTAIAILNNFGMYEQADVLHEHYFKTNMDGYGNWPRRLLEILDRFNYHPKELESIYNPNLENLENVKNIRNEWGLMLKESKNVVDLYVEFLSQ